MSATIEYINKYNEVMCDICNDFDYGTFVVIHGQRICDECCDEIQMRLKVNDYEVELRNK